MNTQILTKMTVKRVSKSNISKTLRPCICVNSGNDEEENVIQELDGCVEDLDSLVSNVRMLLISLASLLALLWQFWEWLQS